MGLYSHLRESWKSSEPEFNELYKQKMIQWRQEPVTVRIDRPTRLDRARSLGYKAKNGFVVVRQRVDRGGHMRPKITGGRRPKHSRRLLVLGKNYQRIAEERANDKYPNCEVLNSYFAGKDGQHYWYEIILVDRDAPEIKADRNISWIAGHAGRAYRGLTSAGKKTRGLGRTGLGAEKLRPSKSASYRRKVRMQAARKSGKGKKLY